VLPGWGAGDLSTVGLRSQLSLAGHSTHPWNQGRNEGQFNEVIVGLSARFLDLVRRHDAPVALVGWSLGGIYACHLATRFPGEVRQIVTLGSPLRSSMGQQPPSRVPLTSIWSRNDRVVPWRRSLLDQQTKGENIEVRATHLTLGFDPLVIGAILDRLAQDPDDWRPFRPPRWLRGAYPSGRDDQA
jgi:pimeloyl-ACP methyl ester carboxylesterase